MTIHGMTRTGLATPIGAHGIHVLGDSRKYPYPIMGGMQILTPSCLWKFQMLYPHNLPSCSLNSKIVNPSSTPELLIF